MELRGSKTEKNLWEAFAGESQARNKYTFFASKAKKEGYEQLAAIFTETANNEKEHAKIWFKLLMENGEIPDTLTCLKMAAAGEKPCESGRCESGNDLADRHDAYPAHRDVDHGGEPLRAVDPEGIDDDAYDGDAPDKGQHPVAGLISEDDQAHRRVGSGDQDEDHHVVDFPKDLIDMLRNVEGVVDRACGVEQDHADDEDAQGL